MSVFITSSIEIQNVSSTQETIIAWQNFIYSKKDWQDIVVGTIPKHIGCGVIYELPNFLHRADESFAIADMRQIAFSEPHYHPRGHVEIYFVIQGNALVVVGGKEHYVSAGDVIIIPSEYAHFVIPDNQFVIGVVNTPPFKSENYRVITETNPAFGFDLEQFRRLISSEVSIDK